MIVDTTQRRMPREGREDITPMPVDSSRARTVLRATGDTATVRIFNESNELIRTLRVRADTGFNRVYWGFEMRGVRRIIDPAQAATFAAAGGGGGGGAGGGGGGRFGGGRFGGRGAAEPPGQPVYPGTYKFVITVNGVSDSTLMIVKGDPNVPLSRELYDARMKLIKRLEGSTTRLTAVIDLLADADETVKKVEATLTGADPRISASLRRLNTAMTDSIKNIRDYIFGKKQEKQGYGTPYQVTVNGRLQDANQAVTGKNKIPDAQENRLSEEAEFLVNDVVKRTNNFIATKWKDYQTAVEASQIKLFKDVRPLE